MGSKYMSSYQLYLIFLNTSLVITIMFNVLKFDDIAALQSKRMSSLCNLEVLIFLRTGSGIFTETPFIFSALINTFDE